MGVGGRASMGLRGRAVSYTHLDVYKRQLIFFEQHGEGHVAVARVHFFEVGEPFGKLPIRSFPIRGVERMNDALPVHLFDADVYKRQP